MTATGGLRTPPTAARKSNQPAIGGSAGQAVELALAAIQLELSIDDFAGESAYRSAIERAAERAADHCGQLANRLFVFPESIGHFIPLVYAPAPARRQKTVQRAMAIMAARHPAKIAQAMLAARTLDAERGVMLAVMPAADRLMRDLFARVARRHRAHVVAGSHLRASGGVVTNTSYTFDPEGRLAATTHKVNLVPFLEDDSPGGARLASGHRGDLPVVRAPWGDFATLICYDGFCTPHTRAEPRFVNMGARADELGVHVIANPAANPWPWYGPWVHAQPGGEMLRHEQWRSEGLPATMAGLGGVVYGVTAQLCARILDFDFHGQSEILANTADGVRAIARASSHDRGEVVVANVLAPGARAASAGGTRVSAS